MMEMSCRWWPIWYLLFFCHGAEGQLQWVVKEKVTAYGQNLILFCPVENCCSKRTAWSVGEKSIILDIKTFSNDPNVKYHGTYNKDGFSFVIRNLSRADLNVTYHCGYGFIQSTPKYLLYGDVFRESTRHLQWVVKKKVNAYGQNLILFCPVENCCSETAGWSVGSKSIISDVKTLSNDPNVRYHGTYNRDGFGVVIHNLSEADLNVTYSCVYGFNQSIPRKLLHDDVFKKSTDVPDKDKDNTVAIVVPIVVIILVGATIMAYFVYRSRKDGNGNCYVFNRKTSTIIGRNLESGNVDPGANKPLLEKENTDTDKEMKASTRSDNQAKNQQETEEEDLYKGCAKKYGIKPEILEALLDDKTFFGKLIKECKKDREHHSGVNSRVAAYFPATLLQLVTKYQGQHHTRIVDTILTNMLTTLTTTEVILCHRSVKSAMIKANEEDYKEQKKLFEDFIKENKFYYDDRFLEQYKYKSRQRSSS